MNHFLGIEVTENLILKSKERKSIEQTVDEILRSYLIRCYATVSKQYPPIVGMNPEEGVECLFKLRNEGKIRIVLVVLKGLLNAKLAM